MQRLVIAFGLCGLAIVGFAVWVAANAQFTFQHPRARNAKFAVTKNAVTLVAKATPAGAPIPAAADPESFPSAVVEKSVYDFGYMDPSTSAKHEFVVRNEGQAPLQLQVSSTTCKCTVGGVADKSVLPGQQTMITLEWNSGRAIAYQQSATIRTNDPRNKELQLTVRGKVRQEFGADVDALLIPNIQPDQAGTATALLYSQVWDKFAVEDFQTKIAGADWTLTPEDPAQYPELEARSVQRLTLTIPGDLPQGEFSDTLRMRMQPLGGEGEAQPFELPLAGKVMRRLAVYGSAISGQGVIDFGIVRQGVGKKLKLLLKVRDSDRSLPMQKIEVEPNFIQAQVVPRGENSAETGLYDLLLEIPADAQTCQLLGEKLGQIRLITDHPRIGELPLAARLAVVPGL